MNVLQMLFLVLLGAKFFADFALDWTNRSYVLKKAKEFEANGFSTAPKVRDGELYKNYGKSVDYTVEKIDFGFFEMTYAAVWSAVLVLFLLAPIYDWTCGWLGMGVGVEGWSSIWREGVALIGVGVVLSWVSLPLDAYSTFRIEEKYGFNKSSVGLWFTDLVKSVFLAFAIGLPVMWALIAFFYAFPQSWWIIGQCVLFGFQLFLLVVFPKWILPLFNKLTPLPEGELRDRLEALAKRTGFIAEKIEVIDGSKRSGHSNAFFTGFGKWRRIVIYDTLIKQLSPEEIEAVLAHEIGHSRRGHITKRLIIGFFSGFVTLGLIAWILNQAVFFESFGFAYVEGKMFVPALLLLSQILPLITFWTSPVSNYFSRKHEYEADAFAREVIGSPEPLVAALEKLHTENLSNLTPHPLFSAFHYSHPTLFERVEALRKNV